MEITKSWVDFKAIVSNKNLHLQYDEPSQKDYYNIFSMDGFILYKCILEKGSSDASDFETNFKVISDTIAGESIMRDSEGATLTKPKFTKTGWMFRMDGFTLNTSNYDSPYVYEKADGSTISGVITAKFFNAARTELVSQSSTDTDCKFSEFDWEVTHDYEIIGGACGSNSLTNDIKSSVVAVPDIPLGSGGSIEFVRGVELKKNNAGWVRMDARTPKKTVSDSVDHTNKLRFIFQHAVGVKESINCIMEIFVPPQTP